MLNVVVVVVMGESEFGCIVVRVGMMAVVVIIKIIVHDVELAPTGL